LREIGRGPVLRQLPCIGQLGPSFVRLAPQEGRGLADVARLVDDEDRARIEMVEAGGRSEVSGPHFGGIADCERPRFARRGRPQRIVSRALESGEVGGQPLGEAARGTPEALADGGYARGWEQELRRGQEDGPFDLAGRPLVGRVERAKRIDLVAEELDPDRQLHGGRKDVNDPAAPRELASPRDFEGRAVAQVEEVAKQSILCEARPDA
jgi:hypothetical protein